MEVRVRVDRLLECGSDLDGVEGGIADEDSGVGALEHGDGVGFAGDKGWLDGEELAEEDVGVCQGTA